MILSSWMARFRTSMNPFRSRKRASRRRSRWSGTSLRAAFVPERLEDRTLLTPAISISPYETTIGEDGSPNLEFHAGAYDTAGAQVSTHTLTLTFDAGSSTASPGADFTLTGFSGGNGNPFTRTFSLSTGNGSVNIGQLFDLIDDNLPEGNEVIVFTASCSTAAVGTPVITISVADYDIPTLTVSDVSVIEGNLPGSAPSAQFTVTLGAPLTNAVSFTAQTANGTALAGQDFTGLSSTSLTIPAGSTSLTINIPITSDAVRESDETFTLNLTGITGVPSGITSATATATIKNDDTTVSIADVSVDENDISGMATLTITLQDPLPVTESVTINTADGTSQYAALSGSDFIALNGVTVSFGPLETQKTVSVSLINNLTPEPTEEFFVNLSLQNGSGLSAGDLQATVTITDPDQPPPPTIHAGVYLVGTSLILEGDTGTRNVDFQIQLTGASANAVIVSYQLQANGTGVAAASADDFSTPFNSTGFVMFQPGETSKTVTVGIAGDTIDESNEGFKIILTSVTSGIVLNNSVAPTTAPAVIQDDDPRIVSIGSPSQSFPREYDPSDAITRPYVPIIVTFPVSINVPSSDPVTVDVTLTGDSSAPFSADAGDFLSSFGTPVTVTIPAGQSSTTFAITINPDLVAEQHEGYRVSLSNPSSNTQINTAASTSAGAIKDDDQPTASITGGPSSLPEGDTENPVFNYTITLSEPVRAGEFIDVGTRVTFGQGSSGFAQSGDFIFPSPSLNYVRFNAGESTKSFTLTVRSDNSIEYDELFFVEITDLGASPPKVLISPTQYILDGTILNDDFATVTIAADRSDPEGTGSGTTDATFTVNLTTGSNDWLTYQEIFTYTVGPANESGFADASSDDFQGGYPTGTVTFSAQITSGSVTVSVPILQDSVLEQDEKYRITLTGGTSQSQIVQDFAIGTILEDDTATVSLSVPDNKAFERKSQNRTGYYRLTRTASDTTQPLTVGFSLGGTATSGSDYTLSVDSAQGSLSAGSVTFAANVTTIDVTLTAVADDVMEGTGSESALLTLNPPQPGDGYKLSTSGATSGTVNITDSPHVKIEAVTPIAFETATLGTQNLGGLSGKYRVELLNPWVGDVNVTFLWSGTANPPTIAGPLTADYSLSGYDAPYLTLGAIVSLDQSNPSKELTLTPVRDDLPEGSETAILTLVDNGKARIEHDAGAATVTIYDNGLLALVLDDDGIKKRVSLADPMNCYCIDTSAPLLPGWEWLEGLSLIFNDKAANPTLTLEVASPKLPPRPVGGTSGASGGGGLAGFSAGGSQASLDDLDPGVYMRLQLEAISRSNGASTWSRELFYTLGSTPDGEMVQMGAKFDLSDVPTNMYAMHVRTTTIYKDANGDVQESETLTTLLDHGVMNHSVASTTIRPDRGLGTGWSLGGMKRIRELPDGVWFTPGNGEMHWFRKISAGVYESPRGFFSTLSISGSTFVLTDKFGTKFSFARGGSQDGFLLQEEDRNRRRLTYTYDAQQRLSKIEDLYLNAIQFNYNASGVLVSIQDFQGVVYPIQYDPVTQQLTSVDSPDPDTANSGMESIRRYFSYTDTEKGELTELKTVARHWTAGAITEVEYESTEYIRDSFGDPSAIEKTDYRSEVSNGTPVSSTWTWDKSPISGKSGILDTRDPDVASVEFPAQPLATWQSQNPAKLIGSMMSPDNSISEYQYDWLGDAVLESFTQGSVIRETRFEYNTDGLITAEYLPDVIQEGVTQSLTLKYEYDAKGNRTKYTEYVDPQLSRSWSWTYDSSFSQVTSATDEFGVVTTFTLDAWGNATQISFPYTDGSGMQQQSVTTMTYYNPANTTPDRGRIESITYPDPDGSGSQLAPGTLFNYTAKGQLFKIRQRTPDSGASVVEQWRNSFDGYQLQYSRDPAWFTTGSYEGNRVKYEQYNALNLPRVVIESPQNSDLVDTDNNPATAPVPVPNNDARRKTTYTYDGYGRVLQMTLQDPDETDTGNGPLAAPVYDYAYDGRGNLIEVLAPLVAVVLPDGTVANQRPRTTYVWDEKGQLVSITDPNGGVTSFEYDHRGNVVQEIWPDPDGTGSRQSTVVVYEWDDRDRLKSRRVADPDNSTTALIHETYLYDEFDRLTDVTDVLRSDAQGTANTHYEWIGNDLEVTDARNATTRYDYDERGLLVKVTQPDPDTGAATGPVWLYEYDALGRLTAVKDPLYDDTTNPYRVTRYEYDVLSRVKKVTSPDPDGTGPLPAPFVSYSYDPNGNVTATTDHLNRITDYTYDRLDRIKSTTLPAASSGAARLTQSWIYDRLGRVTATVDQRGETTNYEWNSASWLTKMILPDPDGAGSLSRPESAYAYDANGWQRQQTMPGPNGNTLTSTWVRDALGQVVSQSVPQPGSNSGAVLTSTWNYDGLGRQTSFTDALSNTTTWAYNPAAGTVTTTQPGSVTTITTYDDVGNMVLLTDGRNNSTTFEYDYLNRLTDEIGPTGKTLQYVYDEVGNLIEKDLRHTANPNYVRQLYEYDNLNRVTQEGWKSTTSTGFINRIMYDYNAAGLLGQIRERRGSQTVPYRTSYVYTYDDLDRLTSVVDQAAWGATSNMITTQPAPAPATLSYSYNTDGDLAWTQAQVQPVPASGQPQQIINDFRNDYTYDALGRLTQVVQSGSAGSGQPVIHRKRVDLSYNSAGRFEQIVRSVGNAGAETEVATGTYSYFDGGALEAIEYTHSGAALPTGSGMPSLPAGTDISRYSWSYDGVGRISAFTSELAAGTAPVGTAGQFDYDYDGRGQLIEALFTPEGSSTTGPARSETFDWDNAGNDESNGAVYNSLNQITQEGTTGSGGLTGQTYIFDAEGNSWRIDTVVDGETQIIRRYLWDYRNRLSSYEERDPEFIQGTTQNILLYRVSYVYDAFDRRVMKHIDEDLDGDIGATDPVERYVWDGDRVAMVLDATGNVTHRFLHGPEVDQVFADETAADGVLWYLTDNLHSVRDVVDSTGTVVNHLEYSAFGRITSETDSDATPFFAYTGREWDEAVNLQYNRHRWYDPSLARWISEDPIRWSAGDTNLYRYVENDPINKTDPSGLEPLFGIEWHHRFPQAFRELFEEAGLRIDDAEWGLALDVADHRQLHNNEKYNTMWDNYFKHLKENNIKPTAEMLKDKLLEFEGMDQFAPILAKGKKPSMSHRQWTEWLEEQRRLIKNMNQFLKKHPTKLDICGRLVLKHGNRVVAVYHFIYDIQNGTLKQAAIQRIKDETYPLSDLYESGGEVVSEMFRNGELSRRGVGNAIDRVGGSGDPLEAADVNTLRGFGPRPSGPFREQPVTRGPTVPGMPQ